MSKLKDIKGEKFGRLEVLELCGRNKSGNTMCICKCDCGNITRPICVSNLKNGVTKSCGCLKKEILKKQQEDSKKYNRYEIIGEITKVYFSNCEDFFICDTEIWEQDFIKNSCWGKTKRTTVTTSVIKGTKTLFFHRYITKALTEDVVDHINGNKLDNRLINLRITTQSKNCLNRNIGKNNTSGATGVKKNGDKWVAVIGIENKKIKLGSFDTFEEAKKARAEAELLYFGEYSALLSRDGKYEPKTLNEIIEGYNLLREKGELK